VPRIAPLRGGPPQPSAAVVVVTADLAVTIHGAAEDLENAKVAADALRQVGQARPTGVAFPARPLASLRSSIWPAGRNRRPGNDHGRGPVDEADAMKVPDFTLQRLGGGRLRWSDHAGPPVVLIAGTLHRSLREYHGFRAHI
jgi:hypothetical protein